MLLSKHSNWRSKWRSELWIAVHLERGELGATGRRILRGIDLVCLGVQQEGPKGQIKVGMVGSFLGLGQHLAVSGEAAVWPGFRGGGRESQRQGYRMRALACPRSGGHLQILTREKYCLGLGAFL